MSRPSIAVLARQAELFRRIVKAHQEVIECYEELHTIAVVPAFAQACKYSIASYKTAQKLGIQNVKDAQKAIDDVDKVWRKYGE